MLAMMMESIGMPLQVTEIPIPSPKPHEILLRVQACGVCRTDLHIIDGELTTPTLPLIPGHQVVGTVVAMGSAVLGVTMGMRLGVPWLGGSCGQCRYCQQGQENLCDTPHYTGYSQHGGFAEYCVADPLFCFQIPTHYPDVFAAPLLCAGLIGYRAYSHVGTPRRLGLYGFGSAAHILIQIARYHHQEVCAFVKPGDTAAMDFAYSLGAAWAGIATDPPTELLDAAIIFAPNGELVPLALQAVRRGGCVICAGIHMSDIPSFPYKFLWGERQLSSISNLTRKDGKEFFKLAPEIPIQTTVQTYTLLQANEALDALRHGDLTGSAVIVPR